MSNLLEKLFRLKRLKIECPGARDPYTGIEIQGPHEAEVLGTEQPTEGTLCYRCLIQYLLISRDLSPYDSRSL